MSRTDARKGYTQVTRLALLETDVDEMADSVTGLRIELGKIRAVLIGLLISISTACVLLAINIGTAGR